MNAETQNGKLILYNVNTEISGLEIHYTGNVQINPTMPEGWLCRANNKKIIIFNTGYNKLNTEQQLFNYIGELKIRLMFGGDKNGNKLDIEISNPNRSWNNIYFSNADISVMSENWDKIDSKSKSTSQSKTETYSNIVSQKHIIESNKLLQAEKPTQTPAATTTRTTRTTTTGGY
jgi:hemin uptake protein HemP